MVIYRFRTRGESQVGNFCSNSIEVAVEFGLQGRGIVYAPAEVVDEYVNNR